MANRQQRRRAAATAPIGMPGPVPHVVERIEALLRDAKSGRIRGIAATFVTAESPFTGSVSAIAPGDVLSARLMEAGIEELRHEFLHAVRGR